MKGTVLKLLLLTCSSFFFILLSCSGDSSDDNPGGKEYLLNGSWWVSYSGNGEGYYFDGKGAGYDLSLDQSSQPYIVCSNAIRYTYDGHNLIVIEHDLTRNFTFDIISETIATISINGFSATADRYYLTAGCISR